MTCIKSIFPYFRIGDKVDIKYAVITKYFPNYDPEWSHYRDVVTNELSFNGILERFIINILSPQYNIKDYFKH